MDESYTKIICLFTTAILSLWGHSMIVDTHSTVKFSGFKGKLRSKRKVQWNPESGSLG